MLVALVLLIDQAVKFYIKTNLEYNEEINMFGLSWARLHFVENEGMAFGITFGWEYGKLLLSLFRILMVAGLIWYIKMLLEARVSMGFVYSVGLITAGALGNIIDSAFYGLIFTESSVHEGGLAQLVPPGQGYGTFLHGKVVDMLYFPITWIHTPEWIPWLGGEQYLFFSPIFNIADTAITTGVLTILFFQRRFFREGIQQEQESTVSAVETAAMQIDAEEGLKKDSPAVSVSTEEPTSYETTISASENGDPLGSLARDGASDRLPGEHPTENRPGEAPER